MIIGIHYSEMNEGHMYNIYADATALENDNSLDGGICTGTEADAIAMACDMASDMLALYPHAPENIHPLMND